MAEVSIIIDDSAVRRLLRYAPDRLRYAIRGGMEDGSALLLRELQRYPPAPPNSWYVRTGTLRRSWSREISGDAFELEARVGSNSNMAPYNRMVQDREFQARAHRGRWQTAQDVVERNENRIRQMFNDRIRAALESL